MLNRDGISRNPVLWLLPEEKLPSSVITYDACCKFSVDILSHVWHRTCYVFIRTHFYFSSFRAYRKLIFPFLLKLGWVFLWFGWVIVPDGSSGKESAMQEMQEMWVWSLGREDPLEEGMATHSNILAWRIPQTKEAGSLLSLEVQRIGHDWMTNTISLSP